MPTACCRAYIVVGPTKTKPWRLSALASAADSGVCAGRSPHHERRLAAAARTTTAAGRARPRPRRRSSRSAARALAIAASTLARLRTIPASASSLARSASPNPATAGIEKPGEAARKAGRLRRMVNHDNPELERLQGEPLKQRVIAPERAPPLRVVVRPGSRPGRTPTGSAPALLACPGLRAERRPVAHGRATCSASTARPVAAATSAPRPKAGRTQRPSGSAHRPEGQVEVLDPDEPAAAPRQRDDLEDALAADHAPGVLDDAEPRGIPVVITMVSRKPSRPAPVNASIPPPTPTPP